MASDAQLLKRHFEQRASERLSKAREQPVVVHVGKKSMMYKYTIKRCQQFLDSVDGDLELARQIIDILFDGPEFEWKTRNSVSDLLGDWDAGKAIALSIQAEQEKKQERHKPFDATADEQWEKIQHGRRLSGTS